MKSIMKRVVVVFVLLAVAGFGVSSVIAGDDPLSSINPFFKKQYAELGLTEQQMNAIKTVVKGHLPELQVMTNQYVAEYRALRKLTIADEFDEPAIRVQVAKIAALGADISVKHALIYQKVKPILTMDQLKKAQKTRQFYAWLIDRRIAGIFKWYEE
jgi:hypothetical protein